MKIKKIIALLLLLSQPFVCFANVIPDLYRTQIFTYGGLPIAQETGSKTEK
jgi:hypothetical protein